MSKQKLIITWSPDLLSMVDHSGSTKKIDDRKVDDNYIGRTSRSERESFVVKTLPAALKILNRRNKNNIQVATYKGNVIWADNLLE